MAQVNPNIALSVQAPKIDTGANQLAMMAEAAKLGEYQRGVEVQNKMRDLYSQGIDVSTPEGFKQLASLDVPTALKLRTQALEGRKLQAETGVKEFELDTKKYDKAITDIANYPDAKSAFAGIQKSINDKILDPQKGSMLVDQLRTMPYEKFQMTQIKNLLNAKDRVSNDTTIRGQDLTASTTRRGQDLTNARALETQKLQYDPTIQGNIAESRKLGEARAEGAIAPVKDARANLKALKTAGYDPLTGTDNVSELIKKSTSGAIQTGAAGTLGAFDITTSGQKAIGQLASISKTLTLDLLDGKLGAGISNDDRTALEQRFGDMANPMLTSEKRLASWGEAKEIMRRAAMLPEPGQEAPAPASSGKGGRPSLNDIFATPKK